MWKDKIKRTLDRSVIVQRRRHARQARQVSAWQKAGGQGLPTPHAIKSGRIREVARQFGCRVLVETGTCLGEMVVAAAGDFKRVHSIELSPYLAARATDRLARHAHVTVHQGDSAVILPSILKTIDSRALIWLDAHYSGGVTARSVEDSPVAHELASIPGDAGHCILIDDAHMFVGSGGYPSLGETRELSARLFPGYGFATINNIIEILPAR